MLLWFTLLRLEIKMMTPKVSLVERVRARTFTSAVQKLEAVI